MKKVYVLLGLALLIIAGILYLKMSPTKPIAASIMRSVRETMIPEQYKHMTVPYLRSREYKSTLAPLDLFSENGSYTSYLTSYTSDGLKVNALLTKPAGAMPDGGWPAVIFIHGYIPPTEYATTEKYVAYVDSLARNGFVVFKIDLRGHGNSEGRAGGGYFGSDYVIDNLNAYAALQGTDFVNPNAIGMWGHSMAGNILLRSAAVKKDIPAIVIWAGAVYTYEDQRKYGIQDNSYRPPQLSQIMGSSRQRLYQLVGSPSASSPFWSQVAPTNYLNDLTGAIEIHHAIDDDVVNIGYSRDLITLLDKTSVPHALFEYESGGHNITDPSFSLAIERTVDFYKKYLQ